MFAEVGSFDAKTKLPELLREVQSGQRFTITLRGKPVADLVPSESARSANARTAVAAMQAFRRVRGVAADAVAQWIAEGRR
jgi:prevent-host-death family protein